MRKDRGQRIHATKEKMLNAYQHFLRGLVLVLAVMAGGGIVLMMLTTCVDVVLRALGHPLSGSYDVVRLLSVVTIACALPYTTAVKGHVAVEYFFHKLTRHGRILVDSMVRLLIIALFSVLVTENIKYGMRLFKSGEVTATLQVPIFWVPYVVAFSCAVVVLVVLHNLLHPGRVMIKP